MLPSTVRTGTVCGDDGLVSESTNRPPAGQARPTARPSVSDVFGDVLPDVTSDERTPEQGEPSMDTWYRDNRPPHHDRG